MKSDLDEWTKVITMEKVTTVLGVGRSESKFKEQLLSDTQNNSIYDENKPETRCDNNIV